MGGVGEAWEWRPGPGQNSSTCVCQEGMGGTEAQPWFEGDMALLWLDLGAGWSLGLPREQSRCLPPLPGSGFGVGVGAFAP